MKLVIINFFTKNFKKQIKEKKAREENEKYPSPNYVITTREELKEICIITCQYLYFVMKIRNTLY